MQFDFNTIIPFGKHYGKTIRQICKHEPQYVVWLSKQSNHSVSYPVVTEAQINIDNTGFQQAIYINGSIAGFQ